ncbi:hypothetical protein ACFV5N_05970 [Streptomyces sp. NPDC059853]|uniref:hypothetical protein n=1 Tax=Streptomyces sp. NPDC059853 TaxID=3346973 RepID=UPI0036699D61
MVAALAMAFSTGSASNAEEKTDDVVVPQATSYVGDTCGSANNRYCLRLHYGPYNSTTRTATGSCHVTNRSSIPNHWGVIQGTEIVRYVFRADLNGYGCGHVEGNGYALSAAVASYRNVDCKAHQIYAGTSGQGHSQMLGIGAVGALNSGVLRKNNSTYAQGGCG